MAFRKNSIILATFAVTLIWLEGGPAVAEDFKHSDCYYRVLTSKQGSFPLMKTGNEDASSTQECVERTLRMSGEAGCVHFIKGLGHALMYSKKNSEYRNGKLWITCDRSNRFEDVRNYSKAMQEQSKQMIGNWAEYTLTQGAIHDENSCTLSIQEVVNGLREQGLKGHEPSHDNELLHLDCPKNKSKFRVLVTLSDPPLSYVPNADDSRYHDALELAYDFDLNEDGSKTKEYSAYLDVKAKMKARDRLWGDLQKLEEVVSTRAPKEIREFLKPTFPPPKGRSQCSYKAQVSIVNEARLRLPKAEEILRDYPTSNRGEGFNNFLRTFISMYKPLISGADYPHAEPAIDFDKSESSSAMQTDSECKAPSRMNSGAASSGECLVKQFQNVQRQVGGHPVTSKQSQHAPSEGSRKPSVNTGKRKGSPAKSSPRDDSGSEAESSSDPKKAKPPSVGSAR